MNETAGIYKETIDLAQKFDKKNQIAIKFSSMANLEEMRALNYAEKELIDIYNSIDTKNFGSIDISQVET